jgi:hypothetical protein
MRAAISGMRNRRKGEGQFFDSAIASHRNDR